MLPIAVANSTTLVSKVVASPIAAFTGARLLYNATATAGIAIYGFGKGGGLGGSDGGQRRREGKGVTSLGRVETKHLSHNEITRNGLLGPQF